VNISHVTPFNGGLAQRMETELPRHRQTEMRGAANEVAAT
jgi:hypothetical protein